MQEASAGGAKDGQFELMQLVEACWRVPLVGSLPGCPAPLPLPQLIANEKRIEQISVFVFMPGE
jgi:hypothetical protein